MEEAAVRGRDKSGYMGSVHSASAVCHRRHVDQKGRQREGYMSNAEHTDAFIVGKKKREFVSHVGTDARTHTKKRVVLLLPQGRVAEGSKDNRTTDIYIHVRKCAGDGHV